MTGETDFISTYKALIEDKLIDLVDWLNYHVCHHWRPSPTNLKRWPNFPVTKPVVSSLSSRRQNFQLTAPVKTWSDRKGISLHLCLPSQSFSILKLRRRKVYI